MEENQIQEQAELKETPPSEQEKIKQSVEEFIAKDENRQSALQLAEQMQDVCGKNWFTVDRLVSKSAESRESALAKIQLLKLFGLAQVRVGDTDDNYKNEFRKVMVKVTISDTDKIDGLDRIIWYHKNEIAKLANQRNNLIAKNQIAKN